jgi:hypothetical protein
MKRKKEVLYLRIDSQTKRWLKQLAAKQRWDTSLSAMAEQIFERFKKARAK